ncbi:hypothetical protein A8H39_34330 [Paraburkholderia fungorum]|nr:hypothetical protein A8H39_34330 [Paraburkholderia fungorum]
MYILGICTALAVTAGCSTTNTSTAANSLIQHDAEMKDVARCGGLGVDDRVGLTIAAEKDKYGGELSAERASEIRIDAMRNGLLTGDDKKYQAYVQCILELDKRRASNLSSAERLEQPFIKVQLTRPSAQANRAMLSVDNTGGELTELSVRPLTFLYIGELRMAGTPQAASDSPLRAVYVPVVGDYEGFEAFPAEYKGRLYETFTMDERKFDDNVAAFANSDGRRLNTYVLYFAVVDYKDKFNTHHHRVFEVTTNQHELDEATAARLVSTYGNSVKSGVYIDTRHVDATALAKIWPHAASPRIATTPWGTPV